MTNHPAISDNEMERLLSLSALDLNYSDLNESLSDLTRLAAGIAGTSISLVNLVDAYTQWSVSRHGLPLEQMPREDSVCQYTILEEQQFEVKNLSTDERFKDKDYVAGDLKLSYYFGVPLKTSEGLSIGALCVLDKTAKTIDSGKAELLKIIAKEIVVLLNSKKIVEELKTKLTDIAEVQGKLAHDIRGPIAGIIGLARLFKNKVYETKPDKLQEVLGMIENGGESIISLAEDIMNNNRKASYEKKAAREDQYNLSMFKEAIEKLYLPMARSKGLQFTVKTGPKSETVFFSKAMLMQICGNLISNAVKFTPVDGLVTVKLSLDINEAENTLHISVEDNGVGITRQTIANIMEGTALSTNGTSGENGYGFGLCLVKRLVESLNGTIDILSKTGEGTRFNIVLPQKDDDQQMTSAEPAFSLATH